MATYQFYSRFSPEGMSKRHSLIFTTPAPLSGDEDPQDPPQRQTRTNRLYNMNRCKWVNLHNDLYVKYHDEEWGRPLHDDRLLFEMLILEGCQAGLSWEIILNKREGYRRAYKNFDPATVAQFNAQDEERLRNDPGIIRNRLKIAGSIANARVFLQIQQQWGTFDRYIWHFTNGQTLVEPYTVRTHSPLSDEISRDMKRQGMKFVGTTIIYSFLQAIGVLNAHGAECDLHPHSHVQ